MFPNHYILIVFARYTVQTLFFGRRFSINELIIQRSGQEKTSVVVDLSHRVFERLCSRDQSVPQKDIHQLLRLGLLHHLELRVVMKNLEVTS